MECVLSSSSLLLAVLRASDVGMLVNREVTSKIPFFSSVSSFISMTVNENASELRIWWSECPTRDTKMEARNLAMLYVTEFMLLTMCLKGAPSLFILESPKRLWSLQDTNGGRSLP